MGDTVLFGGGLSLASAINSTGLAGWFGEIVSGLEVLPVVVIVSIVILLVIFLTEITSNTATAATLLPILASVAIGLGQNPLLFALPAVIAASCAFMLPVATPPNAIVYGSGKVTIPQMAKAGFWLNIAISILLLATKRALGGVPIRVPNLPILQAYAMERTSTISKFDTRLLSSDFLFGRNSSTGIAAPCLCCIRQNSLFIKIS